MKQYLLLFALLLSQSAAFGQENIDLLIQQVGSNNASIQAINERYKADKVTFRTEYYLPNPEIEGAYFFGRPTEIGNRIDFSITQTMRFPTYYINQRNLSGARIAQLEHRLRQEQGMIYAEAMRIAVESIFLNKQINLLAEQNKLSEELFDKLKKQFDLGAINIVELNKARLNRLNTQSVLNRARIEQKSLNEQLLMLNGGSTPQVDLSAYPTVELPTDFATWYGEVAPYIPELLNAEQSVAIARQAVRVNQDGWLPNLKIGYSSENALGQVFRGAIVGISLPLWENSRKVTAAKASLIASQFQQKEAQLVIRSHYISTFDRLQLLRSQTDEYRTLIEQSNSHLYLTKAYEQGELSSIQLINELIFHFDSVLKYLEVERDLYQTYYKLSLYRLF